MVLFESQARGDAGADSDYDLLVVEPSVEDRVRESVRLRRELRGLGVSIDLVVMDEDTANRRAAVEGTLRIAPVARAASLSRPEHREVSESF